MTEEIPKLDVKTLEYVCKMVEKDYEYYLERMEKTSLQIVAIRHQGRARALDKIDRELHFLIDKIQMEQEA